MIVPDTSLLPPLTSQIEPYVEQAAETRAKELIRKAEQVAKHGSKQSNTQQFQPYAPANPHDNFSRSPRAPPQNQSDDDDGRIHARRYAESTDSKSPEDSIFPADFTPAKSVPKDTKRKSSNSSPNTRSGVHPNTTHRTQRPVTGIFDSPATHDRRSPSSTGGNSSVYSGIHVNNTAVESLAAMKMHDYVVNRKNKKSQKYKVIVAVCSYVLLYILYITYVLL